MSCDQAWTCQELVDHADNWSLAGNVGLLKHMEQFAENLFKQADETNNNLENLLQDLSSTEIQLDLVKNQFLGLQNTQFIESRVYEDDETVTQPIVTPTEVKLDENKKKELLKTAVIDGLKVIDKYYDKISIPESDSEGDETDCSNYVLREKDPYIHRPLPYVIGTDEWHTKWHAGLVESSEDSDNDDEIKQNGRGRVEDEFSDTDSESNLPVADRRRMETQDYTYDEVNGNDNSVSAKTPITNATFAEQLAAKLGDVLTTPTAPSTVDILNDPEVNTRPIQRKPVVNSNLLPDLPPDITTGLFSGGGGLFDDDDDDYQEKPPPIGGNSAKETKKVPNLFDDDDNDDDDDAFSIKPPPIQGSTTNKVDKSPQKRVGSLFDDTDEDDEVLVKSEVETRTVKTAVIDGLKVIDKYYDKISIPESDSEGDETDCSNYVLREKDPYIHRPLPYVIGTDEWHTKWHAGLVESSEESDNDDEIKQNGRGRVEDEFSDTDSESNLPVADRRRLETQDYTYDEVNGNDNSVSAKTPITNATFAEQLAAKLGDVLTTPTAPSTVDILNDPEVNTRPIQRKPVVNSSLLPDLPPDITTGLFSGGGGLFDDDDDDYQEKPPPIGGNSSKETKKVPNLFDDDENDDDDDAFSIKPPPIQSSSTNKVDKSPQKRVGSLFDDTDEDDEVLVKSEVETRRKPIGGVSVLPRRQVYSSDDEDESEKSEKIIEKPTKEEKPIEENIIQPPPLIQSDNKPEKRVLSLFDDTDDLFEDDLFLPSNISKKPEKPKSQAVKIDEGDVSVPPPLFKPVSTTSTTISQPQEAKTVESSTKKKKTRNLFDESSSEDEDDMFSSVIVPKTTPKPKNIDLFADTDVIFTENITKTTENVEKHEKSDEFLPSNEVSVDIPDVKPVVKPRFSLFDDKPPALLSDDDWDEEIPAIPVKKKLLMS
ncbi:WASH complex subunit 2A [Atheta coriaria]|uniref:WASH complex subunit 2A n=1 Tax=Dalotia coriaria TaxID=877792 RepID=UPI0031F35677